MTNEEIDSQMSSHIKTERKITREILELIRLAEHQRLPQERGFRDTYDWLIRGHGYSGSAANRRIQASRLLREIPEVAAKVENGSLNLTTLWQAQKTMRAQQKITGRKVTLLEKKTALKRIEGKTSDVAERELNTLFPEGVRQGEKTTHKRDGGLGIFVELTQEEAQEFARAREVLSHAMPGATFGQVIARLAKEFNQRKDPLRKPHLVAAPQRGKCAQTRRNLIQKAGGRCGYTDRLSGRVCGSRYQLEIDHIVPRAKGGSDDPLNLRCLCRRHNQLMAEREFGREFMDRRRTWPAQT